MPFLSGAALLRNINIIYFLSKNSTFLLVHVFFGKQTALMMIQNKFLFLNKFYAWFDTVSIFVYTLFNI